jgi:hypothetical protein
MDLDTSALVKAILSARSLEQLQTDVRQALIQNLMEGKSDATLQKQPLGLDEGSTHAYGW